MSKLNLRDEAPPLPNGFELTELNPEFLRDPHPMLDRLREEAPRHMHRHSHFPDAPEGLYLTRIEDVRAVFSDPSYQRDPRATPPGSLARAFAPASISTARNTGGSAALSRARSRRRPCSQSAKKSKLLQCGCWQKQRPSRTSISFRNMPRLSRSM
jgi:hypothetical protein